MTRPLPRRRPGFTLVELLVAIAVAIALSALAAGLAYSGAFGSQRVITSADRVSGWLLIAKQRALRDGQPRGVRFFKTGTTVTQAQYIESPDPWVPNPDQSSTGAKIVFAAPANGTTNTVSDPKAYFYDPNGSYGDFDEYVKDGDTLVVPGLGTFRLKAPPTAATITVDGATNKSAKLLDLASYPDLGTTTSANGTTAAYSTTQFAFLRQPRPLFGEPLLSVPETGAIDIAGTAGSNFPTGTPTESDILFTPGGRVLNQSGAFLALWVRDLTMPNINNPDTTDFDKAGQQVLVIVYPKTGAIATQPVIQGATPFQAATDGINTGL